ncbi:MAG TPA: 3-methyl-2-oxobutanoate dehydrogenase subunit VorB [Thermoplasmata archaeon]|nr:3-methyl-2-oxobutanoate dehydrogenase subunit VorB [Thermoplasmata archaeon]
MIDSREFLKGNEALAYGALRTGLNAYFGYPITPSSEIPETLAAEYGRSAYPEFKAFLQAASEIEAINLAIGAAAAGAKVMTATSGPGFSLKQEGISYAAAMELPILIVDVNRAGPGLGNLGPEQTDYFQATRGGGHGGYRTIVLAPGSVPEMALFPSLGFELGFRYRTPVVILADAFLGQLKEDLVFPPVAAPAFDTAWATTGARGDERHVLSSIHLEFVDQSRHSEHLREKYAEIERAEPRSSEVATDDAEVVIVAYGICARLARKAVRELRGRSVRAGLLRPVTLWPFPSQRLRELVGRGVRNLLVFELNSGQMVDDVRLAAGGRARVESFGRLGGLLPTATEVASAVEAMLR